MIIDSLKKLFLFLLALFCISILFYKSCEPFEGNPQMQDVNIKLKLKPYHDRRVRRRRGKRGRRYRHFNRGAYTNKLKTFFLKDTNDNIIYTTPFKNKKLNNPHKFETYEMTASLPIDTSIAEYGIKLGNNDVKIKESEIIFTHDSPACLLNENTPHVETSRYQPSPFNTQNPYIHKAKEKKIRRNGTGRWYLDIPLKLSEYCGVRGLGAINPSQEPTKK